MATTDKDGNWINARGKSIDPSLVNPVDKKRDQIVGRIAKAALRMQMRMEAEKAKYYRWVGDYIKYLERRYKVEKTGKGNLVLTNFSGDMRIEIRVHDVMEFDERLQLAKTKIDDCIKKWSKGANDNLRAIVDQAFEVDKAGKINKHNVLALRRLKISDDDWKYAMELIDESLNVIATKQYMKVQTRTGPESAWQTVDLNFSTL